MTSRLLEDQAALVTGASSGIGRAIALAFGAAGAAVTVNYRSEAEEAEAVAQEIAARGGKAFAIRADVSREDEVGMMVDEAIRRFGTLDILVANAGIQRDASFTDMTLEDWRSVLDVNLTGTFLCCKAVVPEFLRRGVNAAVSVAAGKILCISSVHQRIPWAGRVNYAASKGGIHMFMESLAQELAPRRIRVNAIAPGAIRTDINRPDWETVPAAERTLAQIPYGRIGDPEDVAKAAVWLASDEADYVTGTTLFVDGGMALYPSFG